MPPETVDAWAWLARIRRTQGRKGEVFAEILTDFPEKFSERRRLWLIAEGHPKARPHEAGITPPSPREVELTAHWPHKGGIVLHFAGVDSISSAQELVGLGVAIPKADRAKLAEDEIYISDLIGCALIDVAPEEPVTLGTIEDVDRSAGPVPLLIVRGAMRNQILIPFAKSYMRRLDPENKRVEMALPEGLANLNQSGQP